jgi:hypothetical protein
MGGGGGAQHGDRLREEPAVTVQFGDRVGGVHPVRLPVIDAVRHG